MSKEINLLPEIAFIEEKELRIKKLLTLLSVTLLIIGIVVLLITFTIQIFLEKQRNDLVETNNKLRNDITNYAAIESEQRAVVSKISAIRAIRDDSKNFETYLDRIITIASDGIELTNINISESLAVQLTGKASSSDSVKTFLSNLINDQRGSDGIFTNISLTSISQSQTGEFQFNISMNVKGANTKTKPEVVQGNQ